MTATPIGRTLAVLGALAVGMPTAAPPVVRAQESALPQSEQVVLAKGSRDWIVVHEAIERGLRYLGRQQRSGAVGSSYPVAVTSLAGLAILGAGHQPNQEPHGRMLAGCLRYLASATDRQSGFITEAGASKSRMHGHCYAVLFLTQLRGGLGAEDEEDVVLLIKRGVGTIERAQSREGGWYYHATNPHDQDEASVTVCALQALRAARNTGFAVRSQTVRDAISYVKKCQVPSTGAFCYGLRERGKTTYALTVAALSTLNAAGVYESDELRRGLDFVRRTLERHSRAAWKAAEEEYAYYGNLYAAQTLYQEAGPMWARWYGSVREELLSMQRPDGSWESRYGNEYATAVALLILEVPLGYLPIFQR